ncbi:putative GTP-binding protein [Salmonella phage Guerrero]|nr:putative GTP-binding protein [Salmonella phage Guerrero]
MQPIRHQQSWGAVSSMKKYIVLITGSRSITERDKIFAKLDELLIPHEIETFIEGEAVGVDLISRDWCEINYVHITPMPIPQNYHTLYGKGAGNQRNKDMLDKALTLAKQKDLEVFGIALWDGSSTGTQDMIKRMKKAGINVNITLMGKPKTKRLL